jgi:NADH dehydrogenase
VPLVGAGHAQFQPITAQDVAACVMATLPGGAHLEAARNARFELAGPETLDQRQIVKLTLESLRRPRPLVPIPPTLVRRSLKLTELLLGASAFATWDEAQLMTIPSISASGSADVRSLGITPVSMASALGL